jgi:NADH dehydrogenase
MSALSASENSTSHYLRTKGEAENLVHKAAGKLLAVTSFRPSVIFGPGDSFINRFAFLLGLAPGIFPLACPDFRLQPVYVEDVTSIMTRCLANPKAFGKRYNLCGPKIYRLKDILKYIDRQMGQSTRIIGLSNRLSWLQAAVLEFVWRKPFSIDNFNSCKLDSICNGPAPEWFEAAPRAMEEIVPAYLADEKSSKFSLFRARAGRQD